MIRVYSVFVSLSIKAFYISSRDTFSQPEKDTSEIRAENKINCFSKPVLVIVKPAIKLSFDPFIDRFPANAFIKVGSKQFPVISKTILMGHWSHCLSVDTKIIVSKNCPIVGDHVVSVSRPNRLPQQPYGLLKTLLFIALCTLQLKNELSGLYLHDNMQLFAKFKKFCEGGLEPPYWRCYKRITATSNDQKFV